MRFREKIRKFFQLSRTLFRILWVVIFFHWIFWASTYARAPRYQRAIKDKEITHHTATTQLYKDNGEGWLGKLVEENKANEMTIGEIEEDILKQIETKTGKKNLSREWTKQLLKLEELDKEIKTLEKKESKSDSEEKELSQKRDNYEKKLTQAREKTEENIKNQLKESDLNITELNDKRGWKGQLFLDPLKFFFISPLNQVCKLFKILANFETPFFLAEIIFKVVIIKLFCLWISYPEWINTRIQENYQKIQNPQLSLEEREQSQQEVSSLIKYQFFNMTAFFLPWFSFLHPSHLDKSGGPFLKKNVPLWPVLLLIIPFLLSVLSTESLRIGRTVKTKEIKDYLGKFWLWLFLFFILGAAWAKQNWGNYWWILLGFGVDFLFNLIRTRFSRTKIEPGHSGTFKVWRVKGNPDN